MAKRFTDTSKWNKPFIRGLQAPYKLLWFYILDDCDHAGIWQVDYEVAKIRIGCDIDFDSALTVFKSHIQVFDSGQKWFIPDFIEFQYGELNPANRVHQSIISIHKKYKIKPLTSPLQVPAKKKKAPTKQQSETETETESKEETETETETEYILTVEKAQPPIIDFVEDVINVFKEYYFNNKNVEYISVGKKNKSNYKDRNAVGGLLKYLKEKYPGEDSATTLNRMRSLFNQCFKINDTWLKNNMTLDTIFNKLNNIILYGQAGNKEPGATNKPKFDPDAMLRKYYDKKSETINS